MNYPGKFQKLPAAAGTRIACVVSLYLLCLVSVNVTYGQATLLGDIGVREFTDDNAYSELTTGINSMFFIGFKSELYTSTWNADGTEDTRLVTRLKSISKLTVVGRSLYFIGDDGVSGPELWKTDAEAGSAAVKVKDIRTGAQGSNIQSMTNVYGTLYFSANDGKHGQELWRSNGGPRNTVMVKDIIPGPGSSAPSSLTGVNGTVFFAAKDGVHGVELWKSTGTAAGTVMVKDIRTEPGLGSSPNQLANVKGTLFFDALRSGVGRELWRSDGTAEGTWLVKDIRPGSIGSGIENTTAIHRTLFFSATDGIHGHELWKSDGTASGTVLVKDLTPGSQGSQGDVPGVSFIGNFANMYGTLFFTALLDGYPYIWKSNGTAAGTVPLHETWGQDPTSPPIPDFVGIENNVYFIQGYPNYGYTVYYMNLNGDIQHYVQFFDVNTYHDEPYHAEITEGGGHLYMWGWTADRGYKIVRSFSSYELFATINIDRNEGSNPEALVHHNNLVYFIADHTAYSSENLWVTDGTPAGTREIFEFSSEIWETEVAGDYLYSAGNYNLDIYKTDLNTGTTDVLIYGHAPARLLTSVNDSLYFVTDAGTLWKSNGVPTGYGEALTRTRPLQSFNSIRTMDALNSSLLFRVVQQEGSEELWKSGETSPTTVKLKTLHSGMAREALSYPTATIGNIHYFVANDGVHGNELWKSRGTASSTSMVIDLNTNEPGSDPEDGIRTFVAFRDTLYFSALGNDGKWSLYKTNGTASGTEKIINLGPVAYAVADLDQLYLFAHESATDSTTVLWRTDGTASGTQRIYDFNSASKKINHTFLNGLLYFSITEGGALWRTDGTTCGTMQVNTGVQGAYPIAAINSTLIFGAYTDEDGQEPYAFNTTQIPGAPCDAAISASGATVTLVTAGEAISSYPNPFTSEFAIRIDGNDHELARIKVVSLAGNPVDEMTDMTVNTDHRIGSSWASGVYLIHVQTKDKVATRMVVKK